MWRRAILKAIRHFLAGVFWRLAFRLEGAEPTTLIGPREAALHERIALERLADDVLRATVGGDGRSETARAREALEMEALRRNLGLPPESLSPEEFAGGKPPTVKELDEEWDK
jgi:hypothetical protein